MILPLLVALGIDWDYALFIVAALGFVIRDEFRSKYADAMTRELHERVAKMELRWEQAAEMEHIRDIAKRLDAIDALIGLADDVAAEPKPARRRTRK